MKLDLKKIFPQLLDKYLLEEINEHGVYREFKKGDSLMEPENFVKSIPLVIHGLIKVYRRDEEGREVLLYYIKPGETCAMSLVCCMSNATSNVYAETEEYSEILLIPVQFLDRWMEKYSVWKAFVFVSYRQKFDRLLEIIDQIAFKKIDDRLHAYMKSASQYLNSRELNSTHQQIASDLGTSREVVSRLLKKMEKIALISLKRNKIILLDSFFDY